MHLEQDHLYHLYNQGNNRGLIFFRIENYRYFQRKIEQHIIPFADLLAWCLMPNHFHLMIAVRKKDSIGHIGYNSVQLSLNNSIATMLSSYTRAINIQQKRTGSLFRERTKAAWLGSIESEIIKPLNQDQLQSGVDSVRDSEYLQTCFSYIHSNPVKSGLVKNVTDWEFSSAQDIAEMRKGILINKRLVEELGLKL